MENACLKMQGIPNRNKKVCDPDLVNKSMPIHKFHQFGISLSFFFLMKSIGALHVCPWRHPCTPYNLQKTNWSLGGYLTQNNNCKGRCTLQKCHYK